MRFCALRQIFFITACVCGKEEVNVPFAVLHFTANALTARVCGREAANVPFAVLRVKTNIFYYRGVCGREEVNVPFAVLRVKANIFYYRARLRQRSGKRAACGFTR